MGGGGLFLGEVGLSGGVCSLRKAVGRGCCCLRGGSYVFISWGGMVVWGGEVGIGGRGVVWRREIRKQELVKETGASKKRGVSKKRGAS